MSRCEQLHGITPMLVNACKSRSFLGWFASGLGIIWETLLYRTYKYLQDIASGNLSRVPQHHLLGKGGLCHPVFPHGWVLLVQRSRRVSIEKNGQWLSNLSKKIWVELEIRNRDCINILNSTYIYIHIYIYIYMCSLLIHVHNHIKTNDWNRHFYIHNHITPYQSTHVIVQV